MAVGTAPGLGTTFTSGMPDRTFLDTNVLVYLYDRDSPDKQKRAREILEQHLGGSLILSTQVLQEFFVTVTRKLASPLTKEEALEALEDLVAFPVVGIDENAVTAAARLSVDHQISLWDALILISAESAGCQRVLTEDLQDGWKILGLEIQNPFRGLG